MQKLEKNLSEMEEVLDLLIANANNLLQISRQVIVEEELAPLQKRQEELLDQLIAKDELFQKNAPDQGDNYQSPARTRVKQKIDKFQQLNQNFIDNITASHGLIQFEKGKIKKP